MHAGGPGVICESSLTHLHFKKKYSQTMSIGTDVARGQAELFILGWFAFKTAVISYSVDNLKFKNSY